MDSHSVINIAFLYGLYCRVKFCSHFQNYHIYSNSQFYPAVFLLASIYYTRKVYWNCRKFRLSIFDWFTRVLICPDTSFVTTLAENLMDRVAWNFIFNSIKTWTSADFILMHIAQAVSLLSIVLTLLHRTKLHAIVPNKVYF